MTSTLLFVLSFALFLTIPGAITGAVFVASTLYYFALRVWQSVRIQ